MNAIKAALRWIGIQLGDFFDWLFLEDEDKIPNPAAPPRGRHRPD